LSAKLSTALAHTFLTPPNRQKNHAG
jgi:hypothetical protein